MQSNEYEGYHGTDQNKVSSILKSNFIESNTPDHWLGSGVYLFIEGLKEPKQAAEEWAHNYSWDKNARKLKYLHAAVLKAKVSGVKVLDLRIQKNLKYFTDYREAFIKKHDSHFKRYRTNSRYETDCLIFNELKKSNGGIDIIIHNVYIKNKIQRIRNINSNVANSTVLCATSADSVDIASIKVIKRSMIRP